MYSVGSLPWSQEALGLIIWFLVLYKSGGTVCNPWGGGVELEGQGYSYIWLHSEFEAGLGLWDPAFKK